MTRPRFAVLAGALLMAGGVLLNPGAAHAHSSELATSPEADSVLTSVPADVVITFDTPIMDIGAALVVRDGSGADATSAAPSIERSRISVPLRDDSARGDFSVAYRVVSEDGHAITAQYAFTVSGGALSSPTPVPTPPTSAAPASDAPPWTLVTVGAAALVGGGAGVVAWKRRNGRRSRAIALER